MNANRLICCLLFLVILVVVTGCSSDQGDQTETAETNLTPREADSLEIQNTLNEILARWRYGDKTALYEQEFDYFKFEFSYDDFLEMDEVKRMNADSAYAFNVQGLEYFGDDSVAVDVEIVFKGETDSLSYDHDTYIMYNNNGRWVRPSFSAPKFQEEFDEARRIADSAAAAEEEMGY
jgi:hypothetical protein